MKLRIFVVDDESDICDIFCRFFSDLGHEVITAPAPEKCSVYKGHQCSRDNACCDLLFIDQHLPKMSGLDYIEMLNERGCKSPPQNRVLMAGNPDDVDMVRAQQCGCRVLIKPISFPLLQEIIDEAIRYTPAKRQKSGLK